jgi:hypothetical protein
MKRKTKRTRVNRAHRHAGRLHHLRTKSAEKQMFLRAREINRAINTDMARLTLDDEV